MSKEKENIPMMAGYAIKPEELPFIERTKRFIFDQNTGAILGRTPSSWAKILVFYTIFYIVLAALFSLMMLALHYTLDPRIPKYKLDSSLIGTNPGMGFRPMPNDSNSLSTLIWYKGTKKQDYQYWFDSLVDFLKDYKTPGTEAGRGANLVNCNYATKREQGKVCAVDVRQFHPCQEESNFGFHLQKPCIFLKLNKIFGWEPDYYRQDDELPDKMPSFLKDQIKNIRDQSYLNNIWVSCEGESPADVENLGAINYVPRAGFPGYFFPYENNEGYQSPLVAVQFENPKTGILLNIECKAWAKNIEHNRKERLGSVHFELMID